MAEEVNRNKKWVFLSHSGEDSDLAKEFSRLLVRSGIQVWLDVEQSKPGDQWMTKMESALDDSRALLLLVGQRGVQRWVDREMRVALDRSVRDESFRLIPILGPGSDPDRLPSFLKQYQWQDFRDGFTPDGMARVVSALSAEPVRPVSVLPEGQRPFVGLEVFDVDDSLLFFGRDRETEELVERIAEASFLAVIGDSGSGKSSLVRAGLIPALLRGRSGSSSLKRHKPWRIAVTRPAEVPFDELAESLQDLDPDMRPVDRVGLINEAQNLLAHGADGLRACIKGLVPRGHRTLLVVDQFEEIFADSTTENERIRYIDSLLEVAGTKGERPVHVLIALHAGFYKRCWEHEGLLNKIGENQYNVPYLRKNVLEAVIEGPLALAGATVQDGLVQRIVDDVGAGTVNLPLLEHALFQLWRKCDGSELTHGAYAEIGGIKGALKKTANDTFESLDPAKKELARLIFLELTQLGEGTADTKRQVRIADLTFGDSTSATSVATVLKELVDARLITVTAKGDGFETAPETRVEIAHEALVREWPQLRDWIEKNREFLTWRKRFRFFLSEWERLGSQESGLLGKAQLEECERWIRKRPKDFSQKGFSQRERQFLDSSIKAQGEQDQRNLKWQTLLNVLQTEGQKAVAWWRVAAVAGAAFLLSLLLSLSPFRMLDWYAYDLLLVTTQSGPPPEDIVLVKIDEASLEELGRWPWPRTTHAKLLNRLCPSGPAAVVFDVVFDKPSQDPNQDQALADAIQQCGSPVVLAAAVQEKRQTSGHIVIAREDRLLPIEMLLDNGAQYGFARIISRPDATVRRALLSWDGKPTLIAQTVAQLPSEPDLGHLLEWSQVPVADYVGDEPEFFIRFLGPAGSVFPEISYGDLLHDENLQVAGQVVLIGGDTTLQRSGLFDRRVTPYDLVQQQGTGMPGVEIQAHALATLLTKRFLRRCPAPLQWLIVLVLAAATASLAYLHRPAYTRAALGIGFLTIHCLIAIASFTWKGFFLPTFVPAAAIVAALGLDALSQRGSLEYTLRRARSLIRPAKTS